MQHVDVALGLAAQLAEIEACTAPEQALEMHVRLMATYQPRIHGVAMALARFAPSDADAAVALEDRMRLSARDVGSRAAARQCDR